MLDALSVDPRRLDADADRAEKRLDDLVPLAADARQYLPCVREKDTPVRALLDISFRNQAFEHLGDGRLRDAEALGNVHLPGLAPVSQQVGDEFDVVLHEFAAAVVPCLPETLRLGIGGDKRTLDSERLTLLFVQFNSA